MDRKTYYSYCLKVDLPKAIDSLKPKSSLKPSDQRFRDRVQSRFVKADERMRVASDDLLTRQVVVAYRQYYRRSLMNLKREAVFQKRLLKDLNDICLLHNLTTKPLSFAKMEEKLHLEFSKRKMFSLFGTVKPLRSLLIWKVQQPKHFKVKLIDQIQEVKVYILDRFVEYGWMHFATFGRHFVGGWANAQAIYCVKPAYNLKSDKFKSSFLGHEAQHFYDYHHFPKLKSCDLEYRAKLMELVLAKRPKLILQKFRSESRNDPSLPHCYAAFLLIKNFAENWTASQIRPA